MTTTDKHMKEPLPETNSPFAAKYAWMTSEAKEDRERGMHKRTARNASQHP